MSAEASGNKTYRVWDREYYDMKSRIFPHPGEFKGSFAAVDEADLVRVLSEEGLQAEDCRWEEFNESDEALSIDNSKQNDNLRNEQT